MENYLHYLDILPASDWLLLTAAVVLYLSLLSFRKQRKQQELQNLSMQSLQRDLRALANAAVGVGSRVREIEKKQRKPITVVAEPVAVAPENKPQPAPEPVQFYSVTNQPYEQAIQMARGGATPEDIVNVCGLSRSEADLITMMHRLDKAS